MSCPPRARSDGPPGTPAGPRGSFNRHGSKTGDLVATLPAEAAALLQGCSGIGLARDALGKVACGWPGAGWPGRAGNVTAPAAAPQSLAACGWGTPP